MVFSVIVPFLNEEAYLTRHLTALAAGKGSSNGRAAEKGRTYLFLSSDSCFISKAFSRGSLTRR